MNTVDVLKYGHLWVLKHLDGLTDSQWETPGVCGVWSVKEIIAHLASFEQMLVELLGEQNGHAGDIQTLDQYRSMNGDRFNALQVSQRRQDTPAETLDEYKRHYVRVMEMVAAMPPDRMRLTGALPWYGMEYDLEDFLVYTFYGHKREHMAQVAVYRDKQGK